MLNNWIETVELTFKTKRNIGHKKDINYGQPERNQNCYI